MSEGRPLRFSRRQFLSGTGKLALGASLMPLVSACSPNAGGPATQSSGGSASSDEPVTLSVAVYAEPSRTPIQEALWKAFQEEHPHIKLEVQAADFGTYYTKLNANMAAGTTPDVFMMSGAYFYNGAMKNAFKELDPFIEASNLNFDDYFTEKPNMEYQGKVYGIPLEIDLMALAYNKTLFDEAGVSYPTDNWTWDDLLEAAGGLTRKDSSGRQSYGIYAVNNVQEMWGNLVLQNGGAFLNADMTKGMLNTPEAIEGIQYAIDLIYKHKVSPTPQGVSSLPGYIESGGSPFLTGLVAMKFQGNYEMTLLSNIENFEWDVVTMPQRKKKGGLGWTQSWVMGANTAHPDESWTLIHWLLTKGQHITAQTPGRGLTPSLKEAAYSDAFIGTPPPNVKAWLDGWQHHFDFGFHPAWLEYQSAYSEALDAVFAGEAEVKPAVDAATQKVDSILARYASFKA